MNGRDRPILTVRHEDRQTIGGADRERNPRTVGDESVAFCKATGVLRNNDYVRVYLANTGEIAGVRPSGTDPSAEAMLQPRQIVERLRVVNIPAVERKQPSVYRVRCFQELCHRRHQFKRLHRFCQKTLDPLFAAKIAIVFRTICCNGDDRGCDVCR